MITRRTFLISILFFSSSVIHAPSLGQELRLNQSGWRATVECDDVIVYSQMSTQSKVLSNLKKGDIVTIDLEFIGAYGAWCSVAEPGKRARLGLVKSECLEREQTEAVPVWQAQLPPAQTRPDSEPAQRAETPSQKHPTKEEIEQEVDRVLASRLNALAPAKDSGQTILSEPFGFVDHASFAFLPRFGAPFKFFRHAAPCVTPSVQMRPRHVFGRR